MNTQTSVRRICNSWYHYKWFRILLLIVGIDMLILGASFALGYDILVFFSGISGTITRAVIGLMYVFAAAYIIKHSLSYKKTITESYLVCQHCARETKGEHTH